LLKFKMKAYLAKSSMDTSVTESKEPEKRVYYEVIAEYDIGGGRAELSWIKNARREAGKIVRRFFMNENRIRLKRAGGEIRVLRRGNEGNI